MGEEHHVGYDGVIQESLQKASFDRLQSYPGKVQMYYSAMAIQEGRTPFLTVKGYVGLALGHIEKGDDLVAFPGAVFSYVLRRYEGMHILVVKARMH